ncbi:MAG: NAD(P)-binding protein, partial [Brevibacterium aurantiacum]
MTQRIGVIGGGAAGLATAALLAREGHTVDLF